MSPKQSGASVHLSSISHQYRGSGLILDQLTFAVQSGEFLSILGPSGCGKSTLLRLLAALEKPDQGSIQVGPKTIKPIRGFVFQEPRLLPWRNVLRNVQLPLELKGERARSSNLRAMDAIERVGLKDSIHKYPAQLSGGMKMRVSVARALVFQPTLLLFDEPFSALDEWTRQVLQDDLRALWESMRMTVVFVTHSVAEAVYLSNRALLLSKHPAHIVLDHEIELPPERHPEIRLETQFSLEIQKIAKAMVFQESSK